MDKIWYVVVDGEKQGPISIQEIAKLMQQGRINSKSYVWRNGFDGWETLESVSEKFRTALHSVDPMSLFSKILQVEDSEKDTIQDLALEDNYQGAAEVVAKSKKIIIATGAGMGVDSGLPDFRSQGGLYKGHAFSEKLGIKIIDLATADSFVKNPELAWGYQGYRQKMFRAADPHQGFAILQNWIYRYKMDYFVVTSNIDQHFQKAGFAKDKIYEKHGSLGYLQCITPCCNAVWPNEQDIELDPETMKALQIPLCTKCKKVARPNVLMFGDSSWVATRSEEQYQKFLHFIENTNGFTVIEIGAGSAIPSIRYLSESLANSYNATVIRINPHEPEINAPHFSLKSTGLKALQQLEQILNSSS